jgi:two-component system, NtrC family, nitrogen regulation response regulator NtrX
VSDIQVLNLNFITQKLIKMDRNSNVYKILIVDDIIPIVSAITRSIKEVTFEGKRIEIKGATSYDGALKLINENDFQLAFLDVKIADRDGLDIVKHIRNVIKDDLMQIVLITIPLNAEPEATVTNFEINGYLQKSDEWMFEPSSLRVIVKTSLRAYEALKRLKDKAARQEKFISGKKTLSKTNEIIGESEKIKEILYLTEKFAQHNTSILILGETGTGKELIAYQIHKKSLRSDKPFIAVNCAAIPSELIESTLFGHEKGSFSYAISRHIGDFERANGGTIFLDEIGDLGLAAQAKILRVLEESIIKRIGGEREIKVDFRLISATNKNISYELKEKNFREDLYQRISGFVITAPPLRERGRDVILIAEGLIDLTNKENNLKLQLTQESKLRLMKYDWPGNVRELRKVLERAIVLRNNDTIEADNITFDLLNSEIQKTLNDYKDVLGQEFPLFFSKMKEYKWVNSQNLQKEINLSREKIDTKLKNAIEWLYKKAIYNWSEYTKLEHTFEIPEDIIKKNLSKILKADELYSIEKNIFNTWCTEIKNQFEKQNEIISTKNIFNENVEKLKIRLNELGFLVIDEKSKNNL